MRNILTGVSRARSRRRELLKRKLKCERKGSHRSAATTMRLSLRTPESLRSLLRRRTEFSLLFSRG
jgi:hypothetical protein